MALKAVGFRVLIKPDPIEREKKTGGGIILPELNERLAMTGQQYGTVVELGPDAYKAYDDGVPWVAEGDRVVYSKYGGKFITDPEDHSANPQPYVVLNDSDILAKIEE